MTSKPVGVCQGFTLWLTPKEKVVEDELSAIIQKYSDKLGTPKWKPHITILGSIDSPSVDLLLTRCRELRKEHPIQTARMTSVVAKDMYFQCVLAAIENTPQLEQLHRASLVSLKPDNAPQQRTYFPHVSLVYGNLEEAVKEEVAREIMATTDIVGQEFAVQMELWDSNGPPEAWKFIAVI